MEDNSKSAERLLTFQERCFLMELCKIIIIELCLFVYHVLSCLHI
jgi:hypothetical protein